jgi:hypothetical protein
MKKRDSTMDPLSSAHWFRDHNAEMSASTYSIVGLFCLCRVLEECPVRSRKGPDVEIHLDSG